VIYRDVLNVKPPMTHLVHTAALLLFGRSMLSIRILDLLWQTATALVLWLLGRRLSNRWYAGLPAAILYALWYYSFDFWNTAQTDGWLTLPVALGVLAFLHARPRPGGRAYLLAGAGIAVGVLFKYPIGILAVFLAVLVLSEHRSSCWKAILLLFLGLGLPVAICCVVLGAQGALGPYVLSQTRYLSSYTGAHTVSLGYLGMLALVMSWPSWPTLALWLGIACALVGAAYARRDDSPPELLPILAWFVAAAISYVSQAKGFAYHGLPLLAPLALLSERLIVDTLRSLPAGWRRLGCVALAELTMLVPAFGYGMQMNRSGAWRAVGMALRGAHYEDIVVTTAVGISEEPGFSLVAEMAAAREIREATDASDTLFVWGFEPTIYFLAERLPASRFLYNHVLYGDWSWPELRLQLMEDLQERPPEFIVVASEDALPLVTGTPDDSAAALETYRELRSWIQHHYVLHAQIENLTLYRAKPSDN